MISALICGIIGYGGLGLAFAGTRIAAAEGTVNTVVSHQNTLNANFRSINTQLTALGTRSSFDAPQAIALVETSVANAELASRTVSHDDAALRDADHGLNEHSLLTVVSNGAVDRVTSRIRHARHALEIARSLAADQVQTGDSGRRRCTAASPTWRAQSEKDAGSLPGARDAVAQVSAHVDQAATLAPSPGLPLELATLTTDLHKLVLDYGRQLDAEGADNYDAAAAISSDVSADVARVAHFDVDVIGAKIDAYFSPQIDRYNQEIRAASS
jgi:hypothetical protein